MTGDVNLRKARKALVLMLMGIEPRQNERLDDYIRRGDRTLKNYIKKKEVNEW